MAVSAYNQVSILRADFGVRAAFADAPNSARFTHPAARKKALECAL